MSPLCLLLEGMPFLHGRQVTELSTVPLAGCIAKQVLLVVWVICLNALTFLCLCVQLLLLALLLWVNVLLLLFCFLNKEQKLTSSIL